MEEMRKISNVPICIISNEDELMDDFGKITSKFVNVFYLKGDCLSIRILRNANIKQA